VAGCSNHWRCSLCRHGACCRHSFSTCVVVCSSASKPTTCRHAQHKQQVSMTLCQSHAAACNMCNCGPLLTKCRNLLVPCIAFTTSFITIVGHVCFIQSQPPVHLPRTTTRTSLNISYDVTTIAQDGTARTQRGTTPANSPGIPCWATMLRAVASMCNCCAAICCCVLITSKGVVKQAATAPEPPAATTFAVTSDHWCSRVPCNVISLCRAGSVKDQKMAVNGMSRSNCTAKV
jgi:hypothetical protein